MELCRKMEDDELILVRLIFLTTYHGKIIDCGLIDHLMVKNIYFFSERLRTCITS